MKNKRQDKNGKMQEKDKDRIRQNKIIIYSIIIFIICIYISTFFAHSIIDRGKIKDSESTNLKNPENHVQGVEDDKTGDNTQNNTTIGNNTSNNTENNVGNNTGNNTNPSEGEIVDNKDRIQILQNGAANWSELKELDIFNNSYFHDEAIIAPGVTGSYSFTVENISEEACIYDITYTEQNIYQINMVYKLKKNGQYIIGNENNWVKYDQLNTQDTTLNAYKKDIYTIEWKWKDADNDTEIGETPGANYKMFIKVDATEKEGV